MQISAKIIEDSISPTNDRLTTIEISLPKVLLAEFNTHRVFSRNFSSSRAIPVKQSVELDFFEPKYFGKNQAGMQAKREEIEDVEAARKIWHDAVEYSRQASKKLADLGLHKQWSNRLNDWHIMAKGIVSSTEWDNWFALRAHEDAQPEIHDLALRMREAMDNSKPKLLQRGEWHLPYISEQERADPFYQIEANKNSSMLARISAARCCRVSYLKHDGQAPNRDEDLALFMRLAGADPRHLSPLEHQACPIETFPTLYSHMNIHGSKFSGNLRGWLQYRQLFLRQEESHQS